ncbi:CAP domain-containing protein [Oxalobacteraceae bacterium A2-2]
MSTPLRRHTLLPAVLLAALLSACGGGGSSSTAPAASTGNPVLVAGAPTLTGDTAYDSVAWINYRRGQAGVPTLVRNGFLDKAALAHSNYQYLNNVVAHEETAGKTGYTGANTQARMAAAGYTSLSLSGEVISAANSTSGFYHAEQLITAIYHRFVLLEPTFKEIGTGAVTSSSGYTYFTANLAAANGLGSGLAAGALAVYPYNGQTQVDTSFQSDAEEPDPVPNQNVVGYPISVQGNYSSATVPTMVVTSFTVAPRGGSALATRMLTSSTDSHTPGFAAAIIPLSTLSSNTVYDVSFAGSINGTPVTRNWSFTTK